MDDEKYKLKYMFDLGSGVCLWTANESARKRFKDYPIEIEMLPVSDDLKERLSQVIECYDQSIDWNDPGAGSTWSLQEKEAFIEMANSVYVSLCHELGPDFDVQNCLYMEFGDGEVQT